MFNSQIDREISQVGEIDSVMLTSHQTH